MSDTPSNITPPLKVVPTLVVGLGGTGTLALQYAKQKIRRQLLGRTQDKRLPRKIPFVEFISLDTTGQEEPVEYLTGDECLNMGHINVPQIISSIDRRPTFRRSLKWFPRHLNPGQIDSGARGVRHIGRLCFFDKKRLVDPRLRDKIRSITDYAAVDKALRENFNNISVEPQSTVDVHIISSLCGGTGSACLLDVAYLIKHIIYELLKQSTNSVAHLVTTDPFLGDRSIGEASREYMRYNFAISLSEIERFMTFDVTLAQADGHGGGHWEAEYLDGSIISSVEKPFSLTYLLGYKEGETLSKENVCELIGESICLTTAHPEGALLKGRLDNIKAHIINQADPSTRKLRAYSSYNAHVLSAEFSEQTAEVAVVLAARAIVDSLCTDSDSAPSVGEGGSNFNDLFGKLARVKPGEQGGGLSLGFSAAECGQYVNRLESDLNFQPKNFKNLTAGDGADAEKRPPWYKRLFGKKERELDVQARSGLRSFNEKKNSRLTKCKRFEEDILNWAADVHLNLRRSVKLHLRNGVMSLGEVGKLLDLFVEEANRINLMLSKRKAQLNYDDRPDTEWIERSIKEKKFQAEATERLRAEVMSRLLEKFEETFGVFGERVGEVKTQCEGASKCLNEARAYLHEQLTPLESFTESSIWSRNLLAQKIEGDLKRELVKTFIERTEMAVPRNLKGNLDDPLAFLADLNASGRARAVHERLREVGSKVVTDNFKDQKLPLNHLESEVLTFDIGKMVDHAAPAWQVERAGSDIAEVSLTNCPRNTKLGEIIEDLGRSISFSQGGTDGKKIFIFRSEHGSTAERLLGFRACLDSVRRKLRVERKSHINDLCLDPDWKIEDPTVSQKAEFYCALFSLGHMFELIRSNGSEVFFRNGSSDFKLAESETASKNVQRSASFASFIQHLAGGRQPSVQQLAEQIEDEWKRRKKEEKAEFKAGVDNHLRKLTESEEAEKKSEAGESEEVEREVEQYRKEIEALGTQVLRPLERLLADERRNGQGLQPGGEGGG
ncbi:MAG TPA: tubulin-like doman-containing protein [Pyrinomonadaceae bacterium]